MHVSAFWGKQLQVQISLICSDPNGINEFQAFTLCKKGRKKIDIDICQEWPRRVNFHRKSMSKKRLNFLGIGAQIFNSSDVIG
ncbi:MAG: hypothetical protein ACI9FN_002028 [Saprospiraceae bacterium]